MRTHARSRRRSRTLSVTLPRIKVKTERRYRAVQRRIPLVRLRDASRLATRERSRSLTVPTVEVPRLTLPSLLSPARVLPQTDVLARRYPRERVMSGQALAKAPVAPTVNLAKLYYTRPDVMVCVRRKQRREVLFALGKGGAGHKRPQYTEESKIICR
ncbi:hypothetical protein [Dipodfec virus RodF1_85]|uniref:Uncharacterized protein n=1 Tax=Dipodfec virus RodF1_85 TaxID=2929314 RepID=A0A976R5K0_9VIRU|nr:hypothetical protein [Dipodfec virus RodF1_85]